MLYDKFFDILSSIKIFAQSIVIDLLQYLPNASQALLNSTNDDVNGKSNEGAESESPSFARSAAEAAASVFMRQKNNKKE